MKSVSKGSRTSDIERMNRMFKIVRKKELNSAVTLMEIEAPFGRQEGEGRSVHHLPRG